MTQKRNDILGDLFKSLVKSSGADLYELDIRKINPRESVRMKCLVPLCEYYGISKVCPPHIPGVAEFREALKDFNRAFLVALREKADHIEKYHVDFRAELKLADIVSRLELAAFQKGEYQAVGLTVGGCKFCPECAPGNEPCRHPFKARPSPEGFGIDITELAREAGVPVEWPPEQYVTFMGLVLI
ncbi:MAG: hypothetical protein CVU89_10180 [Firmicutes bacterium HGW-Firmicutes-14]|nr:MAG: hypothetical protein CVU89_10180 [Firmicutes bacterium HGW-Firmicutes-14]